MMDDADRSDEKIMNAVNDAVEQLRRAPALIPKGSCWFCDEPVHGDLRFCDRNCCDDFQAEEEALKRAGR
jgi:hypothetical protein